VQDGLGGGMAKSYRYLVKVYCSLELGARYEQNALLKRRPRCSVKRANVPPRQTWFPITLLTHMILAN
jgi:hypothetical protein